MYSSSFIGSKASSALLVLLFTTVVLRQAHGLNFEPLPGEGWCKDEGGSSPDILFLLPSITDLDTCKAGCSLCHDSGDSDRVNLSGFAFDANHCYCYLLDGATDADLSDACKEIKFSSYYGYENYGPVAKANGAPGVTCYKVVTTDNPTLPATAIPSWVLEYEDDSLVANFSSTSAEEFTVTYKIGKDRNYTVTLLESGCENELTDDDGITLVSNTTEEISGDPDNNYLHLGFDVEKNATVLEDVYYAKGGKDDKTLNLCLELKLLDSKEEPVKSDKQELSIEFMFNNTFEIKDINLAQIFVGEDNVTTSVLNYVEACTCTESDGECNENPISGVGNDDKVNVCIKSNTPNEIEIDYLDRFYIKAFGKSPLEVIVNGEGNWSSETAAVKKYHDAWKGIFASSIIPPNFYSYEDDVTVSVTGTVFVKLAGSSRRRIAVELTPSPSGHESEVTTSATGTGTSRALQSAGDQEQESAFGLEVVIQKIELELDDANNANGAGTLTLTSGAIAASAVGIIGSAAAAILMW